MAAMTYLQLCQYAHRYLRSGNAAGGSQPTAIPPAATSDQVALDIADAIPRAWEWLQNEHPSWDFMRKQGVLQLTSGQRTYTQAQIQVQIADYYSFIPFWAENNQPYFLLYDGGASFEQDYVYPFVEYIDWRGFRDRLPRPAAAQPNFLTEQPSLTLELDPTPALAPSGSNWKIKFDYRIKNQTLSAGTDVPILPPMYHEAIAWIAIRMICESRMNTGPLLQASVAECNRYMDRLKARFLPRIQVDTCYA